MANEPDTLVKTTTWQAQIDKGGEFQRRATTFRSTISSEDGNAFNPDANRYHLYVSMACPWAHRTLLTRLLKGLQDVITVDVVDTLLGEQGWTLSGKEPGATGDRINGFRILREAYQASNPNYSGSVTVPVLWDKKTKQIVNNESSEIIRQFNGAFQMLAKHPDVDLYPGDLRARIDELNAWIYSDVNNGVYRCGFARSQDAYDRAAGALFSAMDRLESLLAKSRFLTGSTLTEADIRLFPTLVRFDLVYHTHFKCNLRRLSDYPNLWGFTRDIYSVPGVADTVDVTHIKHHYYHSHTHINPYGIVPVGQQVDFLAPNDRASRFA
jgi:glutathionyl-hydroquinone reductase